jgi:hypothetical protein
VTANETIFAWYSQLADDKFNHLFVRDRLVLKPSDLSQSESREPIRLTRENRISRHVRDAFRGRIYQNLAILFCVLFGMAIIVNVELAGNPMWFWYDTLFHGGAKLYADLHLALQPLFVLETNAWMQFAGNKVLAMELLSVIHLLALCLGIQLLVRESTCPDWQKGILVASTFLVCTHFSAYLFNDFHVLTDIFWIYSFVFLLMLAKADAVARQIGLAATLGVLSGLTITLRVNDGAALLVGTGVCILVLARKKKLIVASLYLAVAALTVVLIVRITGDSFSNYISNSILKAAGSKGGTSNLLKDPILLFHNSYGALHGKGKRIPLWTIGIFAAGAIVQRYWKSGVKYLVFFQLGIAAASFAIASSITREQLLSGNLISQLSIFVIFLIYLLAPIIAVRYLMWSLGRVKYEWDAREILVLPLFFWLAAASTSSAGEPYNFFEMSALLFVLVMLIQPFRQQAKWANLSMVPLLVLLGLSAIKTKIQMPYTWQYYVYSPMFENRQWYRHPIYGPMYIERDQLRFIESVCEEIGQSDSRPELLSLPFPYPNYFCAAPPWHGYVQTFFDTSTRPTIVTLIQELQTAPPQWIVYQRQLKILALHERIYNHGQPLAQRDLDELIMQKIATREWQLVDKKNYLEGDGWFVIRTRP